MRPKRWNLLQAAGYGILFGLGLMIVRVVSGQLHPTDATYLMGGVIGATISGAVLGGLVAAVRNLVTRAQ